MPGFTRSATAHDQVLTPYNPAEAISPQASAIIAGKDPSTIKYWAETYHFGRKIAGRWEISHPALLMFLDGDKVALRAYLDGDRQSERVLRYFARAGLHLMEAA